MNVEYKRAYNAIVYAFPAALLCEQAPTIKSYQFIT